MHWLIWQGLLQQYAYVYVLSHHFVDEYGDRTHDEKYQWYEKRN
jgi:hypothetical protein